MPAFLQCQGSSTETILYLLPFSFGQNILLSTLHSILHLQPFTYYQIFFVDTAVAANIPFMYNRLLNTEDVLDFWLFLLISQ